MQDKNIEMHLAQRHNFWRRSDAEIPKDARTFGVFETDEWLTTLHRDRHAEEDCDHSPDDLGGDLT